MNNKILILNIFFIAIFGCDYSVDPSKFNKQELIGKYIANHGKGEDIILLKPDGSFTHLLKSKKTIVKEQKGKWQYETFESDGPWGKEKKAMISFENFSHTWDKNRAVESGIWMTNIEKSSSGKIRLPLDYDMDYYYEKID